MPCSAHNAHNPLIWTDLVLQKANRLGAIATEASVTPDLEIMQENFQ